jgi:hypothetical protein
MEVRAAPRVYVDDEVGDVDVVAVAFELQRPAWWWKQQILGVQNGQHRIRLPSCRCGTPLPRGNVVPDLSAATYEAAPGHDRSYAGDEVSRCRQAARCQQQGVRDSAGRFAGSAIFGEGRHGHGYLVVEGDRVLRRMTQEKPGVFAAPAGGSSYRFR